MIDIYHKQTGDLLGQISEEDLQFLIKHLEKEFPEDIDYYINQTMLDVLIEKGLNPEVVQLIEHAMGPEQDVEIKYKRG